MADGQFNYTIIKCSIYMPWQSERGCGVLARDDRGWKLNNLTDRYSLGVSSNYSLFFFSSCWLFIIHDRLRVLFYSLFHWHGCVILHCYTEYDRFWRYLSFQLACWYIHPGSANFHHYSPPPQWIIVKYYSKHKCNEIVSKTWSSYG